MNGIETNPIVLLTDFGYRDTFSGILKGVIASISPESRVIDLTHGVMPQDILQGSFLLAVSCSYFPKGSIFCVIVDPGVGSERKGIVIQTKDYFFVGPDNGVLWEAASRNTIKRIIHLANTAYFLDTISNTFHGRDIFAPVAAHISKGLKDISVLGNPLKECIKYEFPGIVNAGVSVGLTVINVDRFGNITLNIQEKEFRVFVQDKKFCLTIKDTRIDKIYCSYSEANVDELFLIGSSSSYMEISLKNSSAAAFLGISPRDTAKLEIL